MQVAHGWTGVEVAWVRSHRMTVADVSWLEIAGGVSNVDDSKKVLASRFLRFSLESAMTIKSTELSATCAVSVVRKLPNGGPLVFTSMAWMVQWFMTGLFVKETRSILKRWW